ncbi:MAG: hypothetical protein ABGZ35_23810, partial [Planctomycetaceae bacterium]
MGPSVMQIFYEHCLEWPTLPFSVVLSVGLFYWCLVIFGLFDIDFFDIDLDWDVETSSPLSVGFVGLKFLNIGNVPVMLWATCFAFTGWMLSMQFDHEPPPITFPEITAALARNTGLAILATKILTNPLRGKFDPPQPNRVQDLLGQTCTITSKHVSQRFGQAKLDVGAAPL